MLPQQHIYTTVFCSVLSSPHMIQYKPLNLCPKTNPSQIETHELMGLQKKKKLSADQWRGYIQTSLCLVSLQQDKKLKQYKGV